ncbi:MAG: hypothetical protein QM621_02740 [Aeromicrobium sp.]|uniref:hypothetical protein n=1 Tax=Aeromicrobium sp. TaxID=1871063 RepID=UPI0039E34F72
MTTTLNQQSEAVEAALRSVFERFAQQVSDKDGSVPERVWSKGEKERAEVLTTFDAKFSAALSAAHAELVEEHGSEVPPPAAWVAAVDLADLASGGELGESSLERLGRSAAQTGAIWVSRKLGDLARSGAEPGEESQWALEVVGPLADLSGRRKVRRAGCGSPNIARICGCAARRREPRSARCSSPAASTTSTPGSTGSSSPSPRSPRRVAPSPPRVTPPSAASTRFRRRRRRWRWTLT